MSFCLMRVSKYKATDMTGLQKEARRELSSDKYSNRVDVSRSQENVILVDSNQWLHDAREKIKDAGATERKNSIVGLGGFYGASSEWFDAHTREEAIRFFNDCVKWHEAHYGTVISAIVHFDETTPHMQVMSVPLTSDGRLSARELVGNKGELHQAQTDFWREVGQYYGMERGRERDASKRRKHVKTQEHRIQENREIILRQESRIYEQGLDILEAADKLKLVNDVLRKAEIRQMYEIVSREHERVR